MVLATADTPPFVTESGDGFYNLLLTETFRRLDVPLEIRRMPSERALQEANSGRVDGEFGRIAQIGDLYRDLRIVPEPLSDWHFSAFVRAGSAEPRSFEDLRNFHVGYIRGWKIYEDSVTDARSVTIAASEEQLFSILLARRVDVILYSRLRGLSWSERNPDAGISLVATPLAVRQMHLFLHHQREELIPGINGVLREIKSDGTYVRLQQEAFGFVP